MASAAAYQRPSARHAGPKEEADFQTYLDFSAISPAVQKHIQKVRLLCQTFVPAYGGPTVALSLIMRLPGMAEVRRR